MPASSEMKIVLDSPEHTQQFGERVGRHALGGHVIALIGELGTGKTVLARGIAQGLGINPIQVNSPTFTLMQIYNNSPSLVHVDLYRLEERSSSLNGLGLHEYFTNDFVVVIEWADRLSQVLPADHLGIQLSHGETQNIRHMTVAGTGPKSSQVVTTLRREWKEPLPA